MTRRRSNLNPPKSYVTPNGHWPIGPFADDSPTQVKEIAAIVQRLQTAIADRSVTSLAVETDLSRFTIAKLVNGDAWPEFYTLSRLQEVLSIDLLSTAASR
jgi:DNA-binding phage protein